MRKLLFTLLLINLLFFGWAHWIDKPPPANSASAAKVPLLELVPSSSPAAGTTAAIRCASLGPLLDRESATALISALRARKLKPRERQVTGEAAEGYWVYIDNLQDSIARTRAVNRLARAGIRDAAALANSGQVSVGLFSEQSGAELRAAAVREAGFQPVIAPRSRPVNEYWFDVDLASDVPLPAVAAVMSGIEAASEPAWQACPTATASP